MAQMTQPVTPTWLRQVATALSTRYAVQVREGKGWAIDVERQVMTYKAEHLLALDRDTCLGILLHELGHLHFTTNDWIEKSKLYKDENLKAIAFKAVNAYEDVRINEKMSQSYGGSRELIDAMNELLGGDGVQSFMEMSRDIKALGRERKGYQTPEWHEVFYLSMARLLGQLPHVDPNHYYDPSKMAIINEISDVFTKQQLKFSDSTQKIYDFVEREVFPRIAHLLPQPTLPSPDGNQPGNQPGLGSGQGQPGQKKNDQPSQIPGESDEGDGEGGDGQGNGSTEGTTDSEERAEDGQPGSTKGDTNKNGENDNHCDSSDEENDQGEASAEGTDSDGNSTGKPPVKPYDPDVDEWKREIEKKIRGAIQRGRVNPDDQYRTSPFGSNGQSYGGGKTQRVSDICNVDRHLEESQSLQQRFKNRFEAVFRDNQYARDVVNQKSGKLNGRVLYKHRLNKENLFKRKSEVNGKSYAVAFAMDLSPSMGHPQIRGSFQAMLAFSTTLQRLKIPYGIGFFSTENAIAKHFHNKIMVNRKVGQIATEVMGGGTYLAPLLRELFGKELAQQQVEEKIGIILTDGLWGDVCYQQLIELKKQNRNMHLYVVTLGMHERQVESIEDSIQGSATVLNSETPEGVIQRYLEIAKKHLL
jgi:hypothetical protein